MHNRLPMSATIARRIPSLDPTCSVCGDGSEDARHLFFDCAFARRCWLLGRVPLKTYLLIGSVKEILVRLASDTPDEVWGTIANTLWAIWWCRNAKLYQGTTPTHKHFQSFLSGIESESFLVEVSVLGKGKKTQVESEQILEIDDNGAVKCMLDGSWTKDWQGGMGFIIIDSGRLISYEARPILACSPLHAEAWALKEAVAAVKGMGIQTCVFLSDCKELVEALMQFDPPMDVDWKAFREVY